MCLFVFLLIHTVHIRLVTIVSRSYEKVYAIIEDGKEICHEEEKMNVLHCSATQVRPGRAAWGSRPQLVVVVEGATRVGRAKRNLLLAARTSTDNFFTIVPGILGLVSCA